MHDFPNVEQPENVLDVHEPAIPAEKPDTFALIEAIIFNSVNSLLSWLAASFTTLWARLWQKEADGETVAETSPAVLPATFKDKRVFYLIAILTLAADQTTKWVVEQYLPLNTSWIPVERWYPVFQITHVKNTGVAFGLFQGNGMIFSILAIFVVFGITNFNYQLTIRNRALRITLGLIAGGALGNVIDRFRLGHVTDFLNFNLLSVIDLDWSLLDWPVFNLADMSVIGGTIASAYLLNIVFKQMAQIEQHRQLQQLVEEAVAIRLPRLLSQMEADGKLLLLDDASDTPETANDEIIEFSESEKPLPGS